MPTVRSSKRGLHLDFEDVRDCVDKRLADQAFSTRLGAALSGRFREIVIDEAQDCSPADLKIIEWLRASGIKVKVVCDPNQAIYAFRGGLTDELLRFAGTFDGTNQLPMSGNFRSSPAICAAISVAPARVARRGRPTGGTAQERHHTSLHPGLCAKVPSWRNCAGSCPATNGKRSR